MTQGTKTRLDGETLVVRIPMRFQRRGGCKRMVAPDGSEMVPTSKPQPDGTLLKALARAWRWQRMLDEGIYITVSEIGEAEGIDKGYVSRVLRLALLATSWKEFWKGSQISPSRWSSWSDCRVGAGMSSESCPSIKTSSRCSCRLRSPLNGGAGRTGTRWVQNRLG